MFKCNNFKRLRRFYHVDGKIMKVDLREDEFDDRLYDRDNGIGVAQEAIDELRKEKGILYCLMKL